MTQAIDTRVFLLDRSRQGPLGRLVVDLVKYGAASGAALVLDAGTLLVLTKLGVNYLVAAATGFLAGLVLVYALSVRYVFRDARALHPSHEALGFLLTGVIGLLLNEALMGFFVGYCGLAVALAKIPTVAFVFTFNFTVRRSLLFSHEAKSWAADVDARAADLRALGARLAATPLWAVVLLALLASTAFTFTHAREVWTTGAFFDTDDAMRAVQVRDLLAGQSWFDMAAYRLDPPQGVFSHWSRIVDVPLAAMESFFRLFLSAQHAELVTRLLFPSLLLAALFALSPWFAKTLAPAASPRLAVLLALLSGADFVQFVPGRIDHHAPQIVLLMIALGAYLRGLDDAKARAMLAACAAMALSLAISLENLPFFAVMLAAAPLLFVLDGEKMRAPLAWLAGGLLAALPATYVATVGPSRYLVAACDAYSSVYLAAFVVGAAGLGLLSLLAARLATPRARSFAVGAAGVAVIATFAGVAPNCLGDPLGGIDPLVRELWLSHVTEATPLWKLYNKSPNTIPVTALPVLIGLAVALVQGFCAEGVARLRWFVASGVIVIGFLGGLLWQVRIFTSITPLAMAPLTLLVAGLATRFAGSFNAFTRALCAGVFCLALSPAGLAAFLPAKEDVSGGEIHKPEAAVCRKPDVLAKLAVLPPSKIAASFDFAPYLLAYTQHSAFSGPYHRDNHGNRIVMDAFMGSPDAAERILRDAGAQIVLWCPGEPAGFVKRAPEALAALLAKGEAPAWLEPLSIEGIEPLQVYRLR